MAKELKISKIWISLACILALSGCGKTKEARAQLEAAKGLYESQQFAAAKTAIDSLRQHYPREVEVLKDALTLMRLVERGESERNIAFCDSLTPVRLEEAEALKKGFIYEKDSVYEEIGHYVWKQQTIERNVERSYIRCGVDENGEMYLASVYFGSRPINHTGLKLSAPDGMYAETATIPYDGGVNYRFKDNGNTTEVVTYKGDNCYEAVKFICAVPEKTRIKVEYTGGSNYVITIGDNERNAVCATYALAAVLSDLETMRRAREKATKKIAYIDSKLQE